MVAGVLKRASVIAPWHPDTNRLMGNGGVGRGLQAEPPGRVRRGATAVATAMKVDAMVGSLRLS